MAVSAAQQVAQEIKAYIDKEGSGYRNWYVGITGDPRTRLFTEHGVRENGPWWIYRTPPTVEEARAIEQYFVKKLGTDGGIGGGDDQSRTVYAYKKGSHTKP